MDVLDSTIMLYCFSHAGGSAQVFKDWQHSLPERIQVRGVELPGRGKRMAEPRIADYFTLVEKLAGEIARDIASEERRHGKVLYAGFGHSSGAAFCFGVCTRLSELLGRAPVHCFFAAGPAPHLEKTKRSELTDEELLGELQAFPGTPQVVRDNPDLMRFFLPVMRADFAAHEGAMRDAGRLIDCPVTLFAAVQDELEPEAVWAWARHTAHPVRKVQLPGGHFSILHQSAEMIGHIRQDLMA